jgi:hypothetical protein
MSQKFDLKIGVQLNGSIHPRSFFSNRRDVWNQPIGSNLEAENIFQKNADFKLDLPVKPIEAGLPHVEQLLQYMNYWPLIRP